MIRHQRIPAIDTTPLQQAAGGVLSWPIICLMAMLLMVAELSYQTSFATSYLHGDKGNSLLQVQTSAAKAAPEGEFQSVPQWVAAVFTLVIFIGIFVAYRGHGAVGLLVISTQVGAIIMAQLATKALMNDGFKFPITITSIHFLCVFVAMCVWRIKQVTSGICDRISVMFADRTGYAHSSNWYVRRLFPVGFLQCINVGLNTWSLLYIGAGFNALIGILAPIVTAFAAVGLGACISSMGWFGIALAIVGDALVSVEGSKIALQKGEAYGFVLLGTSLGLCAMVARSIRTVLVDCQMNAYAKDVNCPKLSPIEVSALLSPLTLFLGVVSALAIEGTMGFRELALLSAHGSRMLALSSASAVYLTVMGNVQVKMLGASSSQIAGKLNILVTVALSSALLDEAITGLEIAGAITVIFGAAIFESSESGVQQSSRPSPEDKKDALARQERCPSM